jgi:hypothetical protein
MTTDNREFETRARAAFDASVEGIDGSTRSKLTQARHRALAASAARPRLRAGWLPVGAAAAAVLAVALSVGREPMTTPGASPMLAAAPGEVFDLLAAVDDFDLLAEDVDFYAWVASLDEIG